MSLQAAPVVTYNQRAGAGAGPHTRFHDWCFIATAVRRSHSTCLFILFFWDSRTGQTGWWIFMRDSSLDVKSRKGVPFGGLNDVPVHFGGKTPQKLKFWGVNRTFRPKRQKFQTLITWKLLIRSWGNFNREYAPRVCLRGWSHGYPQQIQDGGGRHL